MKKELTTLLIMMIATVGYADFNLTNQSACTNEYVGEGRLFEDRVCTVPYHSYSNFPPDLPITIQHPSVTNSTVIYDCSGWTSTGNTISNGLYSVTPTGNTTITWNWDKTFNVKVDSATPNAGNVNIESDWVEDGSSVRIIATTTNANYIFDHWIIYDYTNATHYSYDEDTIVTVDAPYMLFAYFVVKPVAPPVIKNIQANAFSFEWDGQANVQYEVKRTTNMVDWATVDVLEDSIDKLMIFTDTADLPKAYYKVTATR